MDGRLLWKPIPDTHPPGLARLLVLLGAWLVVTALAEAALFVFWFTATILVFSVAGALPTIVGIAFAVLALAVTPLGCAWLVRCGMSWLAADR